MRGTNTDAIIAHGSAERFRSSWSCEKWSVSHMLALSTLSFASARSWGQERSTRRCWLEISDDEGAVKPTAGGGCAGHG